MADDLVTVSDVCTVEAVAYQYIRGQEARVGVVATSYCIRVASTITVEQAQDI